MSDSFPTAPQNQPAHTALEAPAPLGSLLAWLVARSGVDEEGFATVAFESPDAVAPGANDPVRMAEALAAAGLLSPALTLIAAALPPREGVWWASLAVRDAMNVATARASAPPSAGKRPPLPPRAIELSALASVDQWIADPSDAKRRAAWEAGQAADLSTAVGCACTAAFFTGGSIASPQSPMAVPPPPGAHVSLAAAAVLLSAVQSDPGNLPKLVSIAISHASEIARHLGGWEAAATIARQHFDTQRENHGSAVAASTPPMPPPPPA